MIHIWKAGDRVELKSGGPVMEVIHYIEEDTLFVGKTVSDYKVLCSWYDKEGHHQEVFHQQTLVRSKKPH